MNLPFTLRLLRSLRLLPERAFPLPVSGAEQAYQQARGMSNPAGCVGLVGTNVLQAAPIVFLRNHTA
jgi:hypothetical protein